MWSQLSHHPAMWAKRGLRGFGQCRSSKTQRSRFSASDSQSTGNVSSPRNCPRISSFARATLGLSADMMIWPLERRGAMKASIPRVAYRSLLHQMTQTTPTALWNDSASLEELTQSIEDGAVGATCHPLVAASILQKDMKSWRPRIESLIKEIPPDTEDVIAWKLVEELSVRAAKLLESIFEGQGGGHGRRSYP